MKSLKIVFAGTPEFAAIIFDAIAHTSHQIVLVMTQPDRPAGRGMKLQSSLVKQKAIEYHLPILQPPSLKLNGKFPKEANEIKHYLENLDFDIMVVAAYGLLLPPWLLNLAKVKNPIGCINVHASLLPRWRGAAPIHRAIWSGDLQTGTCIMQMAEGLDTGDILACESLPIQSLDTTGTLHDRLASQGSRLLLKVLNQIAQNQNPLAVKQSLEGVCYAQKILKEEAKIDWQNAARLIDRQIRALNPTPGAFGVLGEDIVKIWLSEDISHVWIGKKNHLPGEVVEVDHLGICVACKEGVVRLLEIQKAGSKRTSASQFANSYQVKQGDRFQ